MVQPNFTTQIGITSPPEGVTELGQSGIIPHDQLPFKFLLSHKGTHGLP